MPTIVVICPAVETRPDALNTAVLGRPKFAWFVMLNPSARNCSRRVAPSGTFLKRARSHVAKLGPRMVLRPRLPIVPAAGTARQLTLIHALGSPVTAWDEQPGTRSGHCPAPPERGSARARSKLRTGVNGTPERAEMMFDTCHPARTPCATPVIDFANGSSQVELNVKLWRMSKSDGPLFRDGICQ